MCFSVNFKNQLSLWEWAEEIGLDPFVLAGITRPTELLFTDSKACMMPIQQFAQQAGERLAREDIAERIAQAETLIANMMGVFPAPQYFTEEIPYPKLFVGDYRNTWHTPRGEAKSVKASYGFIQAVGAFVDTLLEAAEAVTLSDPYSDGIMTRFALSVAVPLGTTPDQVQLYFTTADSGSLDFHQRRIQGYTVAVSGTLATITGHVALLVRPILTLKRIPQTLNATDITIYASTLDVYLRTIDQAQGGTLTWNLSDSPYGLVCGHECEVRHHSACFAINQSEQAWLIPLPAVFDETEDRFYSTYPRCIGRPPDTVRVNYVSGVPRMDTGLMKEPFRRAVALLATALLTRRQTNCNIADYRIEVYRNLPTTGETADAFLVPPELMQAAGRQFGVMGRGACEAYILLDNHPERMTRTA